MGKPNRRLLYIVADTEAQTAINDEKLNHYVNYELKSKRAQLRQQAKNDVKALHDLKRINKKIDELEPKLCFDMNTYLLGWAPLISRNFHHYENNPVKQQEWINKNVTYYLSKDPAKSPWGNMLDDLVMTYNDRILKGKRYRLVIYFHNLDYDAQHFLQQIVDKKTDSPIKVDKVIYNSSLYALNFEYCNCVFEMRDSMKIYNQALAKLGNNVGWKKQTEKATYEWFSLDDTQKLNDEIFYFKYDIAVLSAVMTNHFHKMPQKAKLTAAGYAEQDLKAMIRKQDKETGSHLYKEIFEPKITTTQEKYIRSAYFGGFVYANRYLLNKKLKRGLVGDVNSLYPSVMLNRDYPKLSSLQELTIEQFYSLDLADFHTFAIVTIEITALTIHDDGVPVIPKKEAFGNSREIYNLSDLGDDNFITVTSLDLFHIKNNYDIEFKFITGIVATDYIARPFANFVLKHKAEKEQAVANHNKVEKLIAKIHLNSSYGKFAQRLIETTHILRRDNDGVVGYSEIPDPTDEKPKNILLAVWITAFARDVLFKAIEKVKKSPVATLWYCDTDAVHFGYIGKLDPVKDGKAIFEEIGLPYSENVFGKWKPEQHMSEAVYLGSKRYWEQDPVKEQQFIEQCIKAGKTYTREDVTRAGATIKGAGIQKIGKDYLVKKGIDNFRYYQDKVLIVPFNASKKVRNGVKIYRTIKAIQPTEYISKFLDYE